MIFFPHTFLSAGQFFVGYRFAFFGFLAPISRCFPFSSVSGFGIFSCLKCIFRTELHDLQAPGSQGPKRRGACGLAIVLPRYRLQRVSWFKCALNLQGQIVEKFESCTVCRLFWVNKCTHKHCGIRKRSLLLCEVVICTRSRGCISRSWFRVSLSHRLGYARHSAHQSSWDSSGLVLFVCRIVGCAFNIRHSS